MPVETIGSCPICEADVAADDVVHDADDTDRLARCEFCGHVVTPA